MKNISKNLKRKSTGRGGFTLVEMLISMTIFMAFTGILISSYTGIVRAQRDANEYREMYVQARQVMETLVQELRDGMVDYAAPNVVHNGLLDGEIHLISRDGVTKTHVTYEQSGVVKLEKSRLSAGNSPSVKVDNYALDIDSVSLNNPEIVKVTKFRLYFSPKIDPYDPAKVNYSTSQFQPRVTIYAEFEKSLRTGGKYTMDLQTTVSSRVYSQVYPTNYLYTNDKFSQILP